MIPLITVNRVQQSKGQKSIDSQWSPKLNGDLREGDPSLTSFTIEGRAEVRELGGHLRLFLRNIKLLKRPLQVTDKLRDDFRKRYRDEQKNSISKTLENSDDLAEAEAAEEAAIQEMIEIEKKKSVQIPSLKVFLTEKKAKARMVDAHKVGIQIRFNIGTGIENFEPKENLIGQFEGTIRDIPESVIMTMQGLVIVKLPQDPPETSEPLVYAYAKLDSARNMKVILF